MGGERNIDKLDVVQESATRTDDPVAQARTDKSPAAFQVKTDTGSYQLHELHVDGAEILPGIGANISESKLKPSQDFQQTEQKQVGDNTVTTYQGKLNDNILPTWLGGSQTNVKMDQTTGPDGDVKQLRVHYDSGQTLLIEGLPGVQGGGMKANDVTDVTITPKADGTSVMKIDPRQNDYAYGGYDTVILGSNGKVAYKFDSTNPVDVQNALAFGYKVND